MRSIASDRVDSLLIRTKGKRVRAPELKCSRINEILHHYYSKFRKISSSSVDVVVRKEEEIEVNVHWLNVCMRMSERRSIAMMFGTMALTARMWLLRLPRRLHSAPRFLDLNCVAAIGP